MQGVKKNIRKCIEKSLKKEKNIKKSATGKILKRYKEIDNQESNLLNYTDDLLQCNVNTLQHNSNETLCNKAKQNCNTDIDIEKEIDIDNIVIAQSDKITHELVEKPAEKIFTEIPLVGDKIYKMPEKLVEEYQKLYAGIDVRQEIKKYKAWSLSNPSRRKTERGILKSINYWLGKEQDKNNDMKPESPKGGEHSDAWKRAWDRQYHYEDGTCTRYSEGD